MEAIKFIGVIFAVWLFVEGAAPVQVIKKTLNIGEDSTTKNLILKLIRELINCALCSGFWIGLAVYHNFWMACIVSVVSEAFYQIVKFLPKKL